MTDPAASSVARWTWGKRAARGAVTIGLLWLVFRRVDLGALWATLAGANRCFIVLGLLVWTAERWIYAAQMWICLRAFDIRIGMGRLMRIILVGMFYGVALPGDVAGAYATWYRLSRQTGTGVQAGFVLVFLRAVSLATLPILGLAGLALDPVRPPQVLSGGLTALLVLLALPSLPFLSGGIARPFGRLFAALVAWRRCPTWLANRAGQLAEAGATLSLTRRRTRLAVLLLALLSHLCSTLVLLLLALAVGIHVSLVSFAWIRCCLFVAQMLPISFAGAGVREVSLLILLRGYGVADASSLALSLLLFAVVIATALAGAILHAWERV